jgi:ABC-type nitrate/sulfonate/bicarbonate transport system substrate-binding protein
MPARRLLAPPLAALALALGGCGTVGDDRPQVAATLVLAGSPQATDAPLAAAVERGYDGAEGVDLTLRPARADGAGVRALKARRADFAVVDAATLDSERELVGVMALRNAPSGARAPMVVLATTRRRLEEDPSVAKAAVAAILRGYEQTQVDPASSLSDLQAQFDGLGRGRLEQELTAAEEQLYPPGRQLGALPLNDPRYDTTVVPAAVATTHDS